MSHMVTTRLKSPLPLPEFIAAVKKWARDEAFCRNMRITVTIIDGAGRKRTSTFGRPERETVTIGGLPGIPNVGPYFDGFAKAKRKRKRPCRR